MSSVAVIGAGAWGTALAIQAARAGNSVTLVGARPDPRRDDRRQPGEPAPARRASARPDRGVVRIARHGRPGTAGGAHPAPARRSRPPATRARAIGGLRQGRGAGHAASAAGDRHGDASGDAGRHPHRAELRPRDRRRIAGRRCRRGRSTPDCARPSPRPSGRHRSGYMATTTRSAPRWAGRRRT